MNFKLVIVLILSLLSDISLQFKDSFCDPIHKNSLIDTVFNSERAIRDMAVKINNLMRNILRLIN